MLHNYNISNIQKSISHNIFSGFYAIDYVSNLAFKLVLLLIIFPKIIFI